MKSAGPMWTSSESDNAKVDEIIGKLREENLAQTEATLGQEQIFRQYPYDDAQLPVLPDCNNYYSGSFGDFFWHQNADQVYVFIPIGDDVSKKEIEVKFAAKSVEVRVCDKQLVLIDCQERIIPDGSFWVVEASNKDGKRYLQLDLEKRFRMINWKNLFGAPAASSSGSGGAGNFDASEQESRSKMLEKLFAANKGMSKLIKDQNKGLNFDVDGDGDGDGNGNDGSSAESIEEMLKNEDLVRMISDRVYGPRGAENGEDLSNMFEDGEGVILEGDERVTTGQVGGEEAASSSGVIDVDVEHTDP
jgi:hypothetical protein